MTFALIGGGLVALFWVGGWIMCRSAANGDRRLELAREESAKLN